MRARIYTALTESRWDFRASYLYVQIVECLTEILIMDSIKINFRLVIKPYQILRLFQLWQQNRVLHYWAVS